MGEVEGHVRSEELDAEREARRQLALAQVRQYPDPVLRLKANNVEEFDDSDSRTELVTMAVAVGRAGPEHVAWLDEAEQRGADVAELRAKIETLGTAHDEPPEPAAPR